MPAILPNPIHIHSRQEIYTTTAPPPPLFDTTYGFPLWGVALIMILVFCCLGLLVFCLMRRQRQRNKQRYHHGATKGPVKMHDYYSRPTSAASQRIDENGWINTRGVGNTSLGWNPNVQLVSLAARQNASGTSANNTSNGSGNNSQRTTPSSQSRSQSGEEEGVEAPPPAYTPRADNSDSISTVEPVPSSPRVVQSTSSRSPSPSPRLPRPTLITTTAFWSRQ